MLTNNELLERIKDFIAEKGISPTEFGLKAKGDPSLIKRLENGQDVRESGKIRILEFMSNYEGE